MEQTGMPERELASALEHESGLLGLAGSADMRVVLARATAGDERAKLGLDVYIHRLSGGIAAMAAAMGGLDTLVFTGGVGEGSSEIRARTSAALDFLGVAVNARLNAAADSHADSEITDSPARVRVFVARAREDLEIARQARAILSRRTTA
jgi:acetate kinase